MKKTIFNCPFCNSPKIQKQGKRKNKLQILQKYKCLNCRRYFTGKSMPNKTYSPNIILNAVSYYNLGNSQKNTAKILNSRFKIKLPQRTISQWIKQYKHICTFSRLRKNALKICKQDKNSNKKLNTNKKPNKMIFHSILKHHQIYNFQLHRAKEQLLSKELPEQKFSLFKAYMEKIPTKEFPHHIFKPKQNKTNNLPRSSQMRFQTFPFIKQEKQNTANKLAELVLNLAQNNRQRHQKIQDFMLINDSTTIAAEIPIYLTRGDINYFKNKGFQLNLQSHNTPITGHIDLLQIRNNLIHILDYKPEANKVNPINQLTLYALALASRTKLALKDFKCAWFDENNYYEFFPLHAVYEKRKNRKIY